MSAQSIAFSMPPASLFDTGEASRRWTRTRRDIAIEHKFASIKLGEVEDDGCFTGYASLFGAVDLGGDVVLPGAFAASLATRGAAGIRMLYQHDPAQPIGVWEDLAEDSKGLYVKGRLLIAASPKAAEAHGLLKEGALDGLSIGYRVQEELVGLGGTFAVGRTPDVGGSIALSGTTLTEAALTADLTTLQSDQPMRDGQLGRQGIRVCSVRPGVVSTDLGDHLLADPDVTADYLAQMPISRAGDVTDVAKAVRFLCGPESGWITGVALSVDGGHHIRRGPDLDGFARALYGDAAVDGPQQ